MEIIKELKKKNNAVSFDDYRQLEGLKVGKYYLSIQGSAGHYCTPRKTVKIEEYSTLEIAIVNQKGSMISANRSTTLKKFSRNNELLSCADSLDSGCCVYGYVPIDLINDLFLFLRSA